MPVFGTSAATFDDDGVTALYHHLRDLLADDGLPVGEGRLPGPPGRPPRDMTQCCRRTGCATSRRSPRPSAATRARPQRWAELARRRQHLRTAAGDRRASPWRRRWRRPKGRCRRAPRRCSTTWPATVADYSGDELVVTVRDRELRTPLTRETLSGNRVRRVALPRYTDDGDLLRFLRAENLPGRFPFTAGVFPFKREGEDPARMFAGEGDAFRTNRRFHLLSEHSHGEAPVDGLRLRHPLRPRSRHPPGRLRQDRHVRRLDRHPRRHEGALRRIRPVLTDDVGVDDDQRAGADDPRVLPQHGDRPAGRPVRRAGGPGAVRRGAGAS